MDQVAASERARSGCGRRADRGVLQPLAAAESEREKGRRVLSHRQPAFRQVRPRVDPDRGHEVRRRGAHAASVSRTIATFVSVQGGGQ